MGEFEQRWEEAGRRAGSALDDASAVVVLGHDPIATASVALGIGRLQAQRRRVAVGDLIGDAAPLRALSPDDDAHGITDAFTYGVSLNKIARQVDASGNLHVLPSGIDQVISESIIRSDRWRRLAGGFHEVGALLLLVAPAAMPGVDRLARMLDGVVMVGGADAPASDARILAHVPSAARRSIPERAPSAVPEPPALRARRGARAAGLAIGVAIAAATLVLFLRGYVGQSEPTPTVLQRDSAAADAAAPTTAAAEPPIDSTPLVPANAADSVRASAFAVALPMTNTEEGAALRVRSGGRDTPVATYAPVIVGGDSATWYKVVTGAYVDRGRAEALLEFLRQRGHLARGAGTVIRAPFALQLASATDSAAAAATIADFRTRRIPVYGLRQSDGSVQIYAGAFESPDEAELFNSTLKSANIGATLVYRVGRAF